jgi:hypothetical protein
LFSSIDMTASFTDTNNDRLHISYMLLWWSRK